MLNAIYICACCCCRNISRHSRVTINLEALTGEGEPSVWLAPATCSANVVIRRARFTIIWHQFILLLLARNLLTSFLICRVCLHQLGCLKFLWTEKIVGVTCINTATEKRTLLQCVKNGNHTGNIARFIFYLFYIWVIKYPIPYIYVWQLIVLNAPSC